MAMGIEASVQGKTKGLSTLKTGAAAGHVFRQTGDGVIPGQNSGLAKVTGRGLKKRTSK